MESGEGSKHAKKPAYAAKKTIKTPLRGVFKLIILSNPICLFGNF
jgi:hypothetical protein